MIYATNATSGCRQLPGRRAGNTADSRGMEAHKHCRWPAPPDAVRAWQGRRYPWFRRTQWPDVRGVKSGHGNGTVARFDFTGILPGVRWRFLYMRQLAVPNYDDDLSMDLKKSCSSYALHQRVISRHSCRSGQAGCAALQRGLREISLSARIPAACWRRSIPITV